MGAAFGGGLRLGKPSAGVASSHLLSARDSWAARWASGSHVGQPARRPTLDFSAGGLKPIGESPPSLVRSSVAADERRAAPREVDRDRHRSTIRTCRPQRGHVIHRGEQTFGPGSPSPTRARDGRRSARRPRAEPARTTRREGAAAGWADAACRSARAGSGYPVSPEARVAMPAARRAHPARSRLSPVAKDATRVAADAGMAGTTFGQQRRCRRDPRPVRSCSSRSASSPRATSPSLDK